MRIYHRLFSTYAVRIERGRAVALKGKITASHLRKLERICGEAGVEGGEIWSNGIDRVSFSHDVPEGIRQGLRNAIFEFLQ
jgi:hypothetical protein